jgi:hypothetical protein
VKNLRNGKVSTVSPYFLPVVSTSAGKLPSDPTPPIPEMGQILYVT